MSKTKIIIDLSEFDLLLQIGSTLGDTYRVAIDEGFVIQDGGQLLPSPENTNLLSFVNSVARVTSVPLTSNFQLVAANDVEQIVLLDKKVSQFTLSTNVVKIVQGNVSLKTKFSTKALPNHEPFAFTISHTSSNNTLLFALAPASGQSGTIDWGDGTTTNYSPGFSTYQKIYSGTGTKKVIITGNFRKFGIRDRITSSVNQVFVNRILSWGNNELEDIFVDGSYNGFRNEIELTEVPPYLPLSLVDISQIFQGCINLNSDQLRYWNTEHIERMILTFYECEKMNQPLGKWNVGNVKSFYGTFWECKLFNQDLGDWDTKTAGSGTGSLEPGTLAMTNMFFNCLQYNQDLSRWNVIHIPSKPSGFDIGTPSGWTENRKPQWGTSGNQ